MTKIFIDGKSGTTGLRIYERLEERPDIELITLSEEKRKDIKARKEALNSCEIAFLCLPDDAAREAVELVENRDVVILDTSTAHRTEEGWVYGFPELSEEHSERIKASKRIAVPGCHASGFIALVHPLIASGIMPPDVRLTCHSITGYSGGGKKMIAEYENGGRDALLNAPRQYGMAQHHKHLREMIKISGIKEAPVFCPIVADFYSGMEVTVPVFKENLHRGYTINNIREVYSDIYTGNIVKYCGDINEEGFLSAAALSNKDSMQISVYGNDDRILLVARYDNLGKGASGAAIECMNLVLGLPAETGLEL